MGGWAHRQPKIDGRPATRHPVAANGPVVGPKWRMMEGTGLRTRSILVLLVVVALVAGCGGGGGGPVASAGRADQVPITIADCAGTPGAIINGAFFKVTLARDAQGGMLSVADILADAQGTATLLSDKQAKFVSDTGQVTGTLSLQSGPLPSC